MKRIIECVPNFSTSGNKTIEEITNEISNMNKVKLLNVESNPDHNRTVVTFAGEPEAVKEAAYNAITKASELIDMTKHKGEHPRIGATDVCPFVPVSDATIDDCVELANELGQKVGDTLNIPVYLYGAAAKNPERIKLADIRKGEYEGLEEKLRQEEWRPDYGPALFNKKTGAVVIGARKFLIAFNINLDTDDKNIADAIAYAIRESGIAVRDKNGKIVKDKNGNTLRVYGRLEHVQAMGVELKEKGLAQVSMNLTDYEETGLMVVFNIVEKLAEKYRTKIHSSEIVGLMPKKAICPCCEALYDKHGGIVDDLCTIMRYAKKFAIADFDPKKKIIEYMI